jgi:hypothetical protein
MVSDRLRAIVHRRPFRVPVIYMNKSPPHFLGSVRRALSVSCENLLNLLFFSLF